MQNSSKNYLLNIGLILLSSILVLVLLEVVLRFTPYKNFILKNEEFRYYYVKDQDQGYDIKPNVPNFESNVDEVVYFPIWSNELGCFDKPYGGNKKYILLLGDSFVHGHAPFEDKWGTQIENILGYQVLKCGVDSYGTKQEFLKAQKIIKNIKASPHLIILGYCLNDVEDDYLFPNLTVIDGYLVPQNELKDVTTGATISRENLEEKFGFFSSRPLIEIKNLIKRESIIGRFLISIVKNKIVGPSNNSIHNNIFMSFLDFPWIENAWENHLKNIDLIHSLARQNNAKLLIVIIPTREQVYPFLFDWKAAGLDPEKPNKKITAFIKKAGINYLDLLPLLKQYANESPRKSLSLNEDLYWRRDGHFSIKGEHLVGLLVAKYIIENNLISIIHKDEKLMLINRKLDEFPTVSHSQ